MQSTLYFQEIVRIKAALEKQNIEYVFLKGLPVHLYYEKTHPRRFYLDADIFSAKRKFYCTQKLLIKNGYKKANTELSDEAWWLKNVPTPEFPSLKWCTVCTSFSTSISKQFFAYETRKSQRTLSFSTRKGLYRLPFPN